MPGYWHPTQWQSNGNQGQALLKVSTSDRPRGHCMECFRSNRYSCNVLGRGTHSFSTHVHPFLVEPWAQSQGLTIQPGSLNLCCDRFVEMPSEYISLRPYATGPYATREAHQCQKDGYDPRLYSAYLNEALRVWIFRWCGSEHLEQFVGEPDCPRHQRCEIVAEVHLRNTLDLKDGDRLLLDVWQPGRGT